MTDLAPGRGPWRDRTGRRIFIHRAHLMRRKHRISRSSVRALADAGNRAESRTIRPDAIIHFEGEMGSPDAHTRGPPITIERRQIAPSGYLNTRRSCANRRHRVAA